MVSFHQPIKARYPGQTKRTNKASINPLLKDKRLIIASFLILDKYTNKGWSLPNKVLANDSSEEVVEDPLEEEVLDFPPEEEEEEEDHPEEEVDPLVEDGLQREMDEDCSTTEEMETGVKTMDGIYWRSSRGSMKTTSTGCSTKSSCLNTTQSFNSMSKEKASIVLLQITNIDMDRSPGPMSSHYTPSTTECY